MAEARQERMNAPSSVEPLGLDPEWLPELTRHYARERFVHLPRLFPPDDAHGLLVAAQTIPAWRVWCGLEHVSWNEQVFEPGHPAYEVFDRDQVVELVVALTGQTERQGLAVWTSMYGPGEYIEPHRDSSGTIQLLLCLQAPSDPANGGELIVNNTPLFLRPGDALAFEATALEHYTTPLIATDQEPSPRRAVLVGRYFLA